MKIWNLVNLRSVFGEFLVEYGFGKFPLPAVWLLRKLKGKKSKAKERKCFYENGETSFVILAKICCF